MNDNELITLVREPFGEVRMTTPLDAVTGRGRVLRRRRRRRGLTGAAALSGGLAAAVALLVSAGQAGPAHTGTTHTGTAVLAAWTVTRDPDGGITVTVNQMKDPAGLQAVLRADGIPARVTFDPQHSMTQPLPAGCTAPAMSDAANARLQGKILNPPAIWAYQQQMAAKLAKERAKHRVGIVEVLPSSLQKLQEKEEDDAAGRTALYLNPAAIPAGIGLSIGVDVVSPSAFGYGVDLVVTSPHCTGS